MAARETPGGMNDLAFEYLRDRYEYDSWRVAEPKDQQRHVWRFFLSEPALPGWSQERIQAIPPQPPWPRSLQSVWSDDKDEGAFASVFVFECAHTTAAREILLRSLATFQGVLERRNGPGDIALGTPTDTIVLLALANVVLIVRNAGPKVVSMTNVAAALEQYVGGRPEPGGKVVPEIQIFAGGDVKPDAAVAPIALEASDPLDRPVWFKLFSETGEVQERRRPSGLSSDRLRTARGHGLCGQ